MTLKQQSDIINENFSYLKENKQNVISDLDTIRSNATSGKSAKDTITTYGDIVTHNTDEFQPVGDYATRTELNTKADDSATVHKLYNETIPGRKTFKLNNSFGNNTIDAIFANGIYIGDGLATTTSRLFNTRWCNNSFQIKTSQDIGYSYLTGSNTTNYGLKYQVQRMSDRSSQPTSAGVVEAGMLLSYDGLIVGYSNQANVKVNDNEFTYVLDQKNVKTKTIDTLATVDKTIIGAINELESVKQDNLTQGDGIVISNNVISSDGNTLQSGGYQKYWQGSKSQFNAITTKDDNTIYQVLDDEETALFEVDGTTIEFSNDDILQIPTNNDFVIQEQTWGNGESGYRMWRNGYLEQWGVATTSASGEVEFTIHTTFRDMNFSVFVEPREQGDFFHYAIPSANNKFRCRTKGGNGNIMGIKIQWRAFGYSR